MLEDGTQADEGTRSLVLEDGPKKKKESVTVLGSPLKRIVLEKETVSVDVSDKVGAKLLLNLKGAQNHSGIIKVAIGPVLAHL